jgi:hypothetical protein
MVWWVPWCAPKGVQPGLPLQLKYDLDTHLDIDMLTGKEVGLPYGVKYDLDIHLDIYMLTGKEVDPALLSQI